MTVLPRHPSTPAPVIAHRPRHDLPALVGNTPVVFIGAPLADEGRGFWAKLEAFNPGGIKDRAALHVTAAARRRGVLAPGAPIVESTSGTMGLGLALAGIVYGHPVTLVSDPGMEPMMRRMLTAYGATVDVVRQPHPVGGWQQARRDRVAELQARSPGTWCPDQYHNPDNPAGYAGLADELVTQLGAVDVLVCAVGTGGHSAGIHARLRQWCPGVQLVGVDSVGSAIFGQPARPRLMRGLGSSILPSNVDYAAFSEVHWVAAPEAVWSARALAASGYVTGGWSVGAIALVAGWLARTRPAGTRIAAVFPDGPHRYTGTVFNDSYCRRNGLLAGPPPQLPDTISHPTQREVTRWARCTTVTAPARPQ
ncbi:PLP-dependent cysteine synthase family protein [Catellatospora methionotrophica]|uniref:PLP-dependent cysteine synthase family protein n=1 Tax=Catellatospora methionotrophica TaxID=121620 RepID=UPI0033C35F0B